MMSELWLWRQCDFILVFMFRQLKTGKETVLLFAKDLKTGLVEIQMYMIFVGSPMCSGNKAADP